MKKILLFLFVLFLSMIQAKAEWINIEEADKPIKLLDTDNIYKINNNGKEGVVFAIRFLGKTSNEIVATMFADFDENKTGVISAVRYSENMNYNFLPPNDIEMKEFSQYKTDYSKVKAYFKDENLKECPEKFLTGENTKPQKHLQMKR